MRTIKNDHIIFKMKKENKPALTCRSGDMVTFHTLDCFSNKLIPEESRLGVDNPRVSNPCTGPLFIKGALPGDTLKIEILDIEVGETGVTIVGPSDGHIENGLEDHEVIRVKVDNGYAEVTPTLSLPIEPMIGILGVAPKEGYIPTALPGTHGGNMDCTQIKKGAIVYLPVFVEGALLSIGDLHALMGDGEVGECGLEIEGKVVVKVSVLSQVSEVGPVVYVDDKWITIASADTLQKASEDATNMMIELLHRSGHSKMDTALILNLAANLKICQIVNRYKTARMELSKKYFLDKKIFD